MAWKAAFAAVAVLSIVALIDFIRPEDRLPGRTADESGLRVVRVCADPAGLPFSNERREGFENRIMALLAEDLGVDLEYFWWAQHRGFVRNTLGSGRCDVLAGVATGMDRVLTTEPYYRSTWVFVSRSDRGLRVSSLGSPALSKLRIGVHLIGDEGAKTPPVYELGRRGLGANLAGFPITGDRGRSDPGALLEGLVNGEVDVAVVWGPLAGYFARSQPVALRVDAVKPSASLGGPPMSYGISLGVRRGDLRLKRTLDEALIRRRSDIESILDEYGVPRVSAAGTLLTGGK